MRQGITQSMELKLELHQDDPAPVNCDECEHSQAVNDPYGTGDRWFVLLECNLGRACPWGINA